MPRTLLLLLATLIAFSLGAGSAFAVCIPFPCPDCDLRSAGQLNFVKMDRDAGKVVLIPNVRFVGNAESFAIVVPTPSLPELAPTDAAMWDQLFAMTRAVTRTGNQSLGCGSADQVLITPDTGTFEDDVDGGGEVIVHNREVIGDFDVAVLSGGTGQGLSDWLNDNGFPFPADQAARFDPYIEDDWVFSAMKLLPGVSVPPGGWDNNVNPLSFTYDSDAFELPLPLIDVNRLAWMPMAFFVVDDHRVDLAGFTTAYANKLTRSEIKAIGDAFDLVEPYLDADRFLTRLDRNFGPNDDFSKPLFLKNASRDEEFRRVNGAGGVLLGWAPVLMVMIVAVGGWGRLEKRVRRKKSRKLD